MAVGIIVSPSTWLNGTVVSPTWLQSVQDNVNFFYGALGGGTTTALSLLVDGTGNQTAGTTAGTVHARNFLASPTNTTYTGIGGGHYMADGTTPTYSLLSGAGTGPSLTISGNDTRGLLNLTTGTGPSASADIVNVIFAALYTGGSGPAPGPIVVITPANSAAGALSGNAQVFISAASNSSWTLRVGSTNLAATTNYRWYYFVMG